MTSRKDSVVDKNCFARVPIILFSPYCKECRPLLAASDDEFCFDRSAHSVDGPRNTCSRGVLVAALLSCHSRDGAVGTTNDGVRVKRRAWAEVHDKTRILRSTLPGNLGPDHYTERHVRFSIWHIRGGRSIGRTAFYIHYAAGGVGPTGVIGGAHILRMRLRAKILVAAALLFLGHYGRG